MLRTLAVVRALTLIACGDDSSAGGSAGSGGSQAGADQGGEPNAGGGASCEVVFRQLQKDAYRETAGRSTSLWPPHTTTTLTYSCEGGPDQTIVMENHGTLPDAKDANGDIILEQIDSQSFSATQSEIEALVTRYQACECDSVTQFLSLDSLGDEAVEAVVGNLIGYLQDNVTCTDPGGVDLLIQNLQNGDVELVLETLPSCTFNTGDFEQGLNEALSAFLAESEALLDDYHVCNNDAVLQAGLIDAFIAGEAVECDATSNACRGPLWFYDPAK